MPVNDSDSTKDVLNGLPINGEIMCIYHPSLLSLSLPIPQLPTNLYPKFKPKSSSNCKAHRDTVNINHDGTQAYLFATLSCISHFRL